VNTGDVLDRRSPKRKQNQAVAVPGTPNILRPQTFIKFVFVITEMQLALACVWIAKFTQRQDTLPRIATLYLATISFRFTAAAWVRVPIDTQNGSYE